jgi:hypothetical protein
MSRELAADLSLNGGTVTFDVVTAPGTPAEQTATFDASTLPVTAATSAHSWAVDVTLEADDLTATPVVRSITLS